MRTALVTGGGGGIGSAICERLAEQDHAVYVLDRSQDTADAVATTINGAGGHAVAIVADVSNAKAAAAACARAHSEREGLDVLVNCAALSGVEVKGDLLDVTPESWRRVIEVDLSGAFFAAQAAARIMVAQRSGCIVNISSVSGLGAEERAAAYCTAKAGLIGLTRAMALELAPHGVRVCAVAPGDIDTAKSRQVTAHERSLFPKLTPLGRGQPEDVADAVAYLVGEGGRFVSGTTLVVDGGLMAY